VKKIKPVEKETGKRKSSNAIPEVFKKKSTAGIALDCSKVKTTKTNKGKGGKRDQNDPIVKEIKCKPVDKS
jgi:hypothetical protein